MKIDIILNVWAAMMIYNLVFKSIVHTVIKMLLNETKAGETVKKTFKEKLADMAKEQKK